MLNDEIFKAVIWQGKGGLQEEKNFSMCNSVVNGSTYYFDLRYNTFLQ